MPRYLAITTCNAAQWIKLGRAMVNTYLRHWPAAVPLRIYTEGFHCHTEHVEEIELSEAAPWLGPWQAARTKAHAGWHKGRYSYKQDAVRFSYKVAALCAAAETTDADVLIWMDADIVTHAPVTVKWLKSLFPPPAHVAWLDRVSKPPETGFLMLRMPLARFVTRMLRYKYESSQVFEYPETHDAYVIGQIVEMFESEGTINVASLSGEARVCGHPFVAGPLGSRMDHLKGSRKELGRSKPTDLMAPRPEPYWRP